MRRIPADVVVEDFRAHRVLPDLHADAVSPAGVAIGSIPVAATEYDAPMIASGTACKLNENIYTAIEPLARVPAITVTPIIVN